VNISPSDKHLFIQSMQDSPIASTTGLGPITNWGQWVKGERSSISFKSLIPAGAKMQMQVLVGPSGGGQRIEMSLGDGVTQVDLPEAGTIATVNLDFKNTLPSGVVEITVPQGLVDSFAIISLTIVSE
jgi:hypothetical protein